MTSLKRTIFYECHCHNRNICSVRLPYTLAYLVLSHISIGSYISFSFQYFDYILKVLVPETMVMVIGAVKNNCKRSEVLVFKAFYAILLSFCVKKVLLCYMYCSLI